MRPPPQLTPEDRRSLRDWSFAMAIVYALLALVVIVSAVLTADFTPTGEPTTNRAAQSVPPATQPISALRASD